MTFIWLLIRNDYSFMGYKIHKKANKNGFTLIELLIVIAIITFISATGVVLSVNYGSTQNLLTAAQDIRATLYAARSEAQSVISQQCKTSAFNGIQVAYCSYSDSKGNSCSSQCASTTLPSYEEDISCGGPTPTLVILQAKTINPQITVTPDNCTQLFQPLGTSVIGSGNIQVTNGSNTQSISVNPNGVIQ